MNYADLGEELDVRVGKDEVEHYVVNEAALAQDLEAARWDMADYRKYILQPVLLSQAVNQAVSQNRDLQAEAYADMESLRKRLDLDMPFADVAEQFSQDPSALSRGDLGLMTEAEVPEWLRPATALEPGGVSPVLDAPEALWTVLLISNNPSNEDIVYHFRGFAIRKRPLAIIVAERTANQPAWVFVW